MEELEPTRQPEVVEEAVESVGAADGMEAIEPIDGIEAIGDRKAVVSGKADASKDDGRDKAATFRQDEEATQLNLFDD